MESDVVQRIALPAFPYTNFATDFCLLRTFAGEPLADGKWQLCLWYLAVYHFLRKYTLPGTMANLNVLPDPFYTVRCWNSLKPSRILMQCRFRSSSYMLNLWLP